MNYRIALYMELPLKTAEELEMVQKVVGRMNNADICCSHSTGDVFSGPI